MSLTVRRKRRLHARNRRIIARRKRLRCRKKPLGNHPSHRLSSKTARCRMILRVGFRNRAEQLQTPEKRRLRRWRSRMSARTCQKTVPPPRFLPRVFRTNPSPEEGLSSVIYNCKMAKTHFCSYGDMSIAAPPLSLAKAKLCPCIARRNMVTYVVSRDGEKDMQDIHDSRAIALRKAHLRGKSFPLALILPNEFWSLPVF